MRGVVYRQGMLRALDMGGVLRACVGHKVGMRWACSGRAWVRAAGSLTVGLVPHVAVDDIDVSRATQVCPMGKARPVEQSQAEVLQLEWSCGTSIRHTPQAPALSQSATSRGQGVAIGHVSCRLAGFCSVMLLQDLRGRPAALCTEWLSPQGVTQTTCAGMSMGRPLSPTLVVDPLVANASASLAVQPLGTELTWPNTVQMPAPNS